MTPMTEFQVVCAWCTKVLSGPDGLPISHGICPACAAGLDAEIDTAAPEAPQERSSAEARLREHEDYWRGLWPSLAWAGWAHGHHQEALEPLEER